jgi:hypothetical protein
VKILSPVSELASISDTPDSDRSENRFFVGDDQACSNLGDISGAANLRPER